MGIGVTTDMLAVGPSGHNLADGRVGSARPLTDRQGVPPALKQAVGREDVDRVATDQLGVCPDVLPAVAGPQSRRDAAVGRSAVGSVRRSPVSYTHLRAHETRHDL